MSALSLVHARGEARADTRLLAEGLRNQHRPVIALIDKYADRFTRFGKLLFEKTPSADSKTGQRERFALLNEDQCYFLLSLSRNTDHVVDLKANLVLAFKQARAGEDMSAIEYLPGYHELHEVAHDLAAGSANERFVHMNLNKLVNKAVGIAAGQRTHLAPPVRSMTATAQIVAAKAMANCKDHHDGYEKAKVALGKLSQLLIGGAR